MSLRIDTSELISGAYVIGETGLGVLGSAVPSSGTHGASFLYNDLSLPADAGKEIRGLILTVPSAGSLFTYEDGSFSLTGAPDATYTFTYRLFVDGTDLGTTTATVTIGTTAALPTIGRPASDITAGAWAPSTGTSLSAMLGEVTADDTTYIRATSLSTCEVGLNQTLYPGSTSQTLRYRASSSLGNSLTVMLKQGSTVIATWSHTLTTQDQLYERVLSAAQMALISTGALSVQLTSVA